jgi:hypothetical protein
MKGGVLMYSCSEWGSVPMCTVNWFQWLGYQILELVLPGTVSPELRTSTGVLVYLLPLKVNVAG